MDVTSLIQIYLKRRELIHTVCIAYETFYINDPPITNTTTRTIP